MTQNDFERKIVPFLFYYWKITKYYDLFTSSDEPIRIGNMLIWCSKSYIPDAILIVDHNDEPIDGFIVVPAYSWKGKELYDIVNELPNGGFYDHTSG